MLCTSGSTVLFCRPSQVRSDVTERDRQRGAGHLEGFVELHPAEVAQVVEKLDGVAGRRPDGSADLAQDHALAVDSFPGS